MSDNGWPDKPGVPPNEGWWWILLPLDVQGIRYFDGEIWRIGGQLADPKDFEKYTLIGPCLTPAEVEARVATARKDALAEAAHRAAKIVAERNQLIGILQLAVEQSGDMDKEPAWFDAACRILNAGFTRAVKGEGHE